MLAPTNKLKGFGFIDQPTPAAENNENDDEELIDDEEEDV